MLYHLFQGRLIYFIKRLSLKLFFFFLFIELDFSLCDSENDNSNQSVDDDDYNWFQRNAFDIMDFLFVTSIVCFVSGEYLSRPPGVTAYEAYCKEIYPILGQIIEFFLGFF